MTTSIAATLQLDFVTAWAAHPFGVFLYFVFSVSAFVAGWGWATKTKFNTGTRPFQRSLMALTIAFALFGIVRFTQTQYEPGSAFVLGSAREQGR